MKTPTSDNPPQTPPSSVSLECPSVTDQDEVSISSASSLVAGSSSETKRFTLLDTWRSSITYTILAGGLVTMRRGKNDSLWRYEKFNKLYEM